MPSCVRAFVASTRWNRSKTCGQLVAGDAAPGVTNFERGAIEAAAERHADLAVERELERVREQVEDDLLPHLAVDIDRLAEAVAVDDVAQAGLVDGGAKHARELHRVLGEIDRLVHGLAAAGLDPREIEERVHELAQAQRVPVRQLQRVAVRLREIAVGEQLFDRADHQRERRAKFVADVGKEGGLRPVQFGERLRAAAFLFERAGIRDRGRNVLCGQRQERPVRIVEHSTRADAGDDDAVRTVGAGPGQRQDRRRV